MEILCNFRLGKEMPESSQLEKVLANNFAWSDAEDNISSPLTREGLADFTFVQNTIGNLPKVPRATFLRNDGLFCFSMQVWQLK